MHNNAISKVGGCWKWSSTASVLFLRGLFRLLWSWSFIWRSNGLCPSKIDMLGLHKHFWRLWIPGIARQLLVNWQSSNSCFLGSSPDRGQSPIEWGNFRSVCMSVRPSPWLTLRTPWLGLRPPWLAPEPAGWPSDPPGWPSGLPCHQKNSQTE